MRNQKPTLAQVRPDLVSQWHPTKNNGLLPTDITSGSKRKVWWVCPTGSKGHEWEASALSRNGHNKTVCPFCAHQKVLPETSLVAAFPQVAKEWHPTKNGNMQPEDFLPGSNKKVWWKCPVAEDHEWEAIINNRTKNKTTCPCCCNRKVVPSNCLSTTHPQISDQWHPSLNNKPPTEVTAGSMNRIWWQCDKSPDHTWRASVVDRTLGKSICPGCSGKQVSITNSLSTLYPEIAKEWDTFRNESSPDAIQAKSTQKVWWRCSKNTDHRWKASLNSRATNDTGCPYCKESKGERLVEAALKDLEVYYVRQHRFPDCRYKKPLPFDFAVQKDERLGLIEFQGRQHYEPIDTFGGQKAFEDLQKRDAVKRSYCESRNIPLLEIRYDQKDQIPQLLTSFMESL